MINFFSQKIVYGVIAFLVFVSTVFIVLKNNSNDEDTLVVRPGDFVQQVSVSGKVVAAQSVDLAFSQTGRVSGVYANVGDTVYAGTVITSVENADLRAEILQKESARDVAPAIEELWGSVERA